MISLKKPFSLLVAAAICIPFATRVTERNTRDVIIDGDKSITAENKLYRGAGMVTGNNSSRLLLDYKDENPEKYREIMDLLFGDKGIGLEHIKIEMGSDINSSSGTEPNIMRSEDETPDVTRGAGYQLAADALTINPDITLDMLYWSEPRWVTDAEDVYVARYRQLLVIGINQKIAIQWDFPITYEMARAYQKANGKYLRQNQWEDITLVMSLELGK